MKHFWVENLPGPWLVSAAGKAFGVEMGNGIQHRAFLLRDFVLRAPGEEQGMGDGGDGSTEGDACWVFCRILGPACGNGILGVLPDPEAVPFCFYFVRLGSNQGCPGTLAAALSCLTQRGFNPRRWRRISGRRTTGAGAPGGA